jgi:branched-chain amino acid transport system substrate-binding protein
VSRDLRDELLDARLRAVLEDRAEDVAGSARSAEQMATELTSRLRAARVGPGTAAALRLAWLAVLVIILIALVAALIVGTPVRPISLRLAIDMPIGAEPGTDALVNAVGMAVHDSANRRASFTLDLPPSAVFKDVVQGKPDDALGAANARQVVADPRYVALIGPYNSSVTEATIPTTNEAGLLQCGPSNTEPALTIGDRAKLMRPKPDQSSYVRVVATDDGLARGAARFLADRLGAQAVYVIESWPQQSSAGLPYVSDLAATFASTFKARGGRLVGQAPFPTGSEVSTLTDAIQAAAPDAIFFHGPGTDGADLLDALAAVGLANLPVVGVDPLLDGPRDAPGSFLNLAADRAGHAYALFPAAVDPVAGPQFEAAYRTEFGAPPPRYAAAAYACAEIVIAALDRLGVRPNASPADWREALRALVAQGGLTFPTVLGSIGFDGNGDVQPPAVSVYAYDGVSADWVFREAIDGSP